MYIVYMAGRRPRQKAKNDGRQQLCGKLDVDNCNIYAHDVWREKSRTHQSVRYVSVAIVSVTLVCSDSSINAHKPNLISICRASS